MGAFKRGKNPPNPVSKNKYTAEIEVVSESEEGEEDGSVSPPGSSQIEDTDQLESSQQSEEASPHFGKNLAIQRRSIAKDLQIERVKFLERQTLIFRFNG